MLWVEASTDLSCSELQLWYSVSKTLAEKAAWDFAAEEGLQMAVLNPGMVLGPMLAPSVNASLQLLLQLLAGQSVTSLLETRARSHGHFIFFLTRHFIFLLQLCNEYKECLLFSKKIQRMSSQSANYPAGEKLDLADIYIGCVDVRDVAHSLIVLYENPSAQGRHLCLESIEHLVDFTNNIADLYPEHRVQR